MSVIIGGWVDPSTNKDIYKNLVRTWFDNTDTEPLVQWKEIFKDLKTEDEYEREYRLGGLTGGMTEVPDGTEIPLSPAIFGNTKDYEQIKYGDGFRITDKMKRFNKIGAMEKYTRSLKKSMAEGKDLECAKIWNNASSTTYASGFDGYQLAYASHPCLDDAVTTFSNYGDSDLTSASYESAMAYFAAIYNDNGQIYRGKASKLMVNRAMRVKAYQLTEADRKPFEFSNTKYEIAKYYGTTITPFVYDRLTSTTSWFLLGDVNGENYGPRVYTALEPDLIVSDANDRTRDTEVTSIQYFKCGFDDAREVYVGDL
jgi:hypothetical protein